MKLKKQVAVLYKLKQEDDRRANRRLHHAQTIVFWLAMIAMAIGGAILNTPEKPWVWTVQLVMIVLIVLALVVGGRTYLIWPDFNGQHDDYA
jgi:hypothetical protein